MILNDVIRKINELQSLLLELRELDEELFSKLYDEYRELAEKTIEAFRKYLEKIEKS